jgi:hypothetical protein
MEDDSDDEGYWEGDDEVGSRMERKDQRSSS